MKVTYTGEYAAVEVPITATHSVIAKWGESTDIPDEIATSLLESTVWVKPGKDTPKAEPDAAPADDNTNSKEKV